MRAICWHGKSDVRVDTVPDPKIEDPRDAIMRITSTCICGSDLHLYDGYMPTMEAGDVLGHEPMGVVEEVGKVGHEAQEGRPRGRPVHDLVRRVLVLRAAALLALRQLQPQRRDRPQGDGPVAGGPVRLLAHARRLPRRPGANTSACRTPTSARWRSPTASPTRRSSSSPTSSRPATWPPRTPQIEPGDTVADLGLRPGRPVRHPQRLDARRRSGRSPSTGCRSG